MERDSKTGALCAGILARPDMEGVGLSAAGRFAVAFAGIVLFALPATAQTLQVETARIGTNRFT